MCRAAGLAAIVGVLSLSTAHAQPPAPPAVPPATTITDLSPVTDAMLANPDPADWPMWRRTLDNWGYSPLDEIDRRNVEQLRLVWSRPLSEGDQEGTPLVHDGILYFPNPFDITQAFDAATGDFIWEYRRKVPEDVGEYFPAPGTNRNLAIYDNLILDNGADGYAYALNARTGELVWETFILDYRKGAKNSSGPIIANGKVISGRSCEPEGGPEACVITAFDALTGKELWRRRTIPKPGERGDETWGNIPYEQRWHVGMWMVPSFDPRAEPHLCGHVRDGAGAQVHARRQRRAVPLPQLHARARRRHRRDRLVLPARRRSLGPRSSVRAAPRRNRARARSGGCALDQPARATRRAAQGDHGRAGQDGYRVYARSRDRRVPMGARDHDAERDLRHQRRVGRSHRKPRQAVHCRWPGEAHLPEHVRRQELSGRHVQSGDAAHVLPAAEHLHDDDVGSGKAERRRALRDPQPRADFAGHRERRHDPGDLRRDR